MFLDGGIIKGMQQPLDEPALPGQDMDTEGKDVSALPAATA